MRVRLRVLPGKGAEEELRSLHAWLLDDSGARRFADLQWEAVPAEPADSMGPVLDTLSLVIGSGFSAASLALSLAQWRAQRGPARPSVTVERPDGSRITFHGTATEETARLLAALEAPAGAPERAAPGSAGSPAGETPQP
ncbi:MULTISPECIES: effector-associated constant component EACC1 [Streptomyces]|uniref:Uncharacterized protein n=1 Tax=Streptomyces albus (strain ATCC 21838 / DSM 41398 / FERM P-419 / JCM 4703 / NBRC 107858) TaxID=1081613 RepID=A0A0B5F1J0_STRA4|nr:hypothetical protein [Streptomyces sp. SCSIO ZS0520]AJE85450.1 hypothetical protein SLNWT_5074 [Streptomyces albus]AOU79754.1 hypothetical protein SLNHY_5063 [Streptomyces albus]